MIYHLIIFKIQVDSVRWKGDGQLGEAQVGAEHVGLEALPGPLGGGAGHSWHNVINTNFSLLISYLTLTLVRTASKSFLENRKIQLT